jgi:hypothetical protein
VKKKTTSKKESLKAKDKKADEKPKDSEKEEADKTYHTGDTIEMKIDMEKIKKGKDQLGLFDD